ncbi:MAG TPA: hypothetical protein VGD14_15955 [bacterium]
MWKIIKADFRYQKFIFIIPYAVILAAIIANVSQGWRQNEHDMQGVRTVMAAMTGILFLFNFFKIIQEKRYRFITLLPLSQRKIALPRILFTIFTWLSFLVMYWLGTAMIRPYRADILIWEMLSFTGFVLVANSAIFIFHDLLYTLTNTNQKAIVGFVFLISIVIGYILFFLFSVDEQSWNIFKNLLLPYKNDFSSFSSNYFGAVTSLLIGIMMTVLSVVVFNRRNTSTQ